jgi:peroxiredoxin
MKSFLTSTLMILFFVNGVIGQTISGTFTGLTNDTLIVITKVYDPQLKPAEESVFRDTVLLENSRFSLNIPNKNFVEVRIFPVGGKASIRPSGIIAGFYESDLIRLFVSQGENISVKAHYDGLAIDFSAKGSELSESYSEFRASLVPHYRKRNEALQEITRLRNAGDPLTAGQDMLKNAITSINEIRNDFVEKNLDSPLAAFIVTSDFGNGFDNRRLISYKGRFQDKVLKTSIGIEYLRSVATAEKSGEREKERMIKEQAYQALKGKPAPDFTLKTAEGKDLTLSSLRGKYVVLEFWGSWCGWCLESMPEMVKYYDKYRQNIIVVTIACDDKDNKWRKAIKDFKMEGFINLFDAEGTVARLYNIQAYPTHVIITPEGIAEPQQDYDVFKRIDELFGKGEVEEEVMF